MKTDKVRKETHTRYKFAKQKFLDLTTKFNNPNSNNQDIINSWNGQKFIRKINQCNNICNHYREEYLKMIAIDKSMATEQLNWISENKQR